MPDSSPPIKRRRLYGKQKVNQWSDPEPPPQSEELCWTCRLCHLKIVATDSRSMNSKRNNHLKCRHPHHVKTDADKFCRFKLQPIVASHEIPKESREWECPWCFKGLPACTGQKQRHKSIQLHWKTDHPNEDTSVSAILKQRAKNMRELPGSQPQMIEGNAKRSISWTKRHADNRDLKTLRSPARFLSARTRHLDPRRLGRQCSLYLYPVLELWTLWYIQM